MASELTLEQKTWHQLECAANSAGGIEVAMVSLPIEQVKALVEGRNTRPAPAATDTGLETWKFHAPINGSAKMIQSDSGEWVPRSQAEELLAAERADKRIWMEKAAIEAERVSALEAKLAAAQKALNAIAHTFTEDSHGNMKTLSGGEYQAMARAVLGGKP